MKNITYSRLVCHHKLTPRRLHRPLGSNFQSSWHIQRWHCKILLQVHLRTSYHRPRHHRDSSCSISKCNELNVSHGENAKRRSLFDHHQTLLTPRKHPTWWGSNPPPNGHIRGVRRTGKSHVHSSRGKRRPPVKKKHC